MDNTADFAAITTEYLAEVYTAQPVMATGMGVHDYDDQLPDYSRFAQADALQRARAYLHGIDKLSLIQMPMEERIDYRLARANTQMLISRLEQARPLERQPDVYTDTVLFGLYLLMARDFADTETRALSLRGRLRAIPVFFRQACENLVTPPRLFTEIGMGAVESGKALITEAIPGFTATLKNATLQKELAEACEDALEAMEAYGRFLREEVLPNAPEDFAFGPELFEYALRIGHFLDETSGDLLEIGQETLEATKQEMARLAAKIDPARSWPDLVAELKRRHPEPDGLLKAYADEMERARDFVLFHRLADVPPHESLTVTETPAFQRAMLPYAAYVPPAPFEAKQAGIFWVTPIDTSAAPAQQEAQLEGHNLFGIPIIALHEAYPGHHLQFSRANQVPSRFRRHFADSNLLIEGWALYCEEMMYAEGFYTDPRVRLMQVKNQLWRACRVLIDVKLHTRQMTFEEAVRFLVEEAHLEEVNARAEVRRYAISPTQPMSYIIGKRQIMELRSSLERRQGARFDLRRFHNDLLSYGAVPPRLIRESMFTV